MKDSTFGAAGFSASWQQDTSWKADPRFTSETGETVEPLRIRATPFSYRDPAGFPKRRWLYGRHLIRKYISCTVAPAGIGKSSLLLVEAVALATGRNLTGKQVHEGAVRVWLINLEDPLEELERRVLAILLYYKIDPADLGDRLFLDSGRTVKVVLAHATKSGVQIATPVVDALKAEIRERAIDVLIVDPMVKAHRVVENDNSAIDMVCTEFAGIADETECAIELVHHVKKGTGVEITVEDGRGASALLGAVRSARVLNPMSKDEAEKAGGLIARDYFRDTNGKANLAPPPDRSDWYHKVSVSLGNGVGGIIDDSDHVGVVEQWQWPDLMEKVTLDHLKRVQVKVMQGTYRENHMAKDWVGKAVAEIMGLDVKKVGDKKVVQTALGAWFASGALVRVMRPDAHRELKPFVEVGDTG